MRGCVLALKITQHIIIIIIIIISAIEFSLGGNSPYTSTDKTNNNKYTYTKQYKNTVQTIQNTVYTSTHITKTPIQLSKHPHIHSTRHYKTSYNNHSALEIKTMEGYPWARH
jgi:hypothetical protein